MLPRRFSLLWPLVASLACSNSGEREPAPSPAPDEASAEPAAVESPNDRSAETKREASGSANPVDGEPARSIAELTDDSKTAEAAAAPEAEKETGPRVYAKTRNVWIRGEPDSRSQWIGFLWFGGSVKLKSTEPRAGWGCQQWYSVEPRGYVCVEGKRATLDADDPVLRGIQPYAPNTRSAWPHPHYGESLGARRYIELPSEELQRARERDYTERMQHIAAARAGGELHESLLDVELKANDPKSVLLPELPKTLQVDRDWLIPRSTLGWTAEAEHAGRSWLLTSDLMWVPKDRVKPYDHVGFRGVHLDERVEFPLAFFRKQDRMQFQRSTAGEFIETGRTFPRLSWVQLTGAKIDDGDRVFLETAVEGIFVLEEDAVVPELRDTTPWGDPVVNDSTQVNATPPTESADARAEGRQTWIDTSILGGWLIAYEGQRPVFTTLIAPGKGGPPRGKIPTLKTASTPTGNFKITGKFATSNMVSPTELVHGDVPWAQNFSGPYALHAAYWHNDWGELKSGGCINVSPLDGKFLYGFTEPAVPPGWFGVRWLPKHEAATTLLVQR